MLKTLYNFKKSIILFLLHILFLNILNYRYSDFKRWRVWPLGKAPFVVVRGNDLDYSEGWRAKRPGCRALINLNIIPISCYEIIIDLIETSIKYYEKTVA